MISFTFETQQPVYWRSVTWWFVLLAVLSFCNGLPHQKTVKIADPFQSASESSIMLDTTEQLETTEVDLGSLLYTGDGAFLPLGEEDTPLAANREESPTMPDTTEQLETTEVDQGSLLFTRETGVVTLGEGDTHLAANTEESSTMPDMTKPLETTVLELGSLLDAGEGAVVTLVARDTRLAAHRAVLAAGSPVLAAMFHPDTLNASGNEVNIPGVEGAVLRQLVAFLYTGRASQQPGMAPQLLAAAEKYGMSTLKDSLEQQVAKQLSVENAAASAVLAIRYSSHSLKQAVVAFIKKNSEVLATKGWLEAVLNHPGDIMQITQLLAESPADTSATSTTDSVTTSTGVTTAYLPSTPTSAAPTTTTATTATADSTSTSTATTPTAPTGCHYTQPPDPEDVSFVQSLSAKEKSRLLGRAAYHGSVQEVRALLAAGIDARVESTALHEAARGGQVETAQCLLQAGAKVDARVEWLQETPLHVATQKGHVAVVRLLLEASADPNAREVDQWTPLHWAAYYGQAEAAAVLLQAGADIWARDHWGRAALDVARNFNQQQMIQMLQSNLSSKNSLEETTI